MNRARNSYPELREHGTFLGKIERNGGPRDRAFNHNLGRNVRVVKLLTFVGLMRQAGKPLTGTVTCIKAKKQNFSSKSGMTMLGITMGSMQSAHFLPGTICVGGIPIWRFATDPETIGYIEALFADVEHLPSVFNQADSEAEAKYEFGGLCAALAAACQSLLTGPAAISRHGGLPGLMGPLKTAYQFWQEGALIGIRNALADKTARGLMPGLVKDAEGNIDLSARENAGNATHNRDDAVRILGYYLEDQNERDWTWVQTKCQTAMGEAVTEFRA
jgi:hypothetical protein